MGCERLGIEIINADGTIVDLTDRDKFKVLTIDGLDHASIRMNTDILGGFDGTFLGRQNYNGLNITINGKFNYFGENDANTRDEQYDNRQELICALSRLKNPITLKIIETLDNLTEVLWQVEGKVRSFNANLSHDMLYYPFTLDVVCKKPFIEDKEFSGSQSHGKESPKISL